MQVLAQMQQPAPQKPPMPPEMQDLLSQLKDIQEPAAIGWWPPAPGWWLAAVLVISLATLAVLALLHFRQKQQRQRYRQEGVRLLQAVDPADSRAVEAINTLLKRVAVVSFGRRRCAALTGASWIEFLQASSNLDIPEQAHKALLENLYRTDGGNDGVPALQNFAIQWVRHHDPKAFVKTPGRAGNVDPNKAGEVSRV